MRIEKLNNLNKYLQTPIKIQLTARTFDPYVTIFTTIMNLINRCKKYSTLFDCSPFIIVLYV